MLNPSMLIISVSITDLLRKVNVLAKLYNFYTVWKEKRRIETFFKKIGKST
jgi:hypothetical protein